MWPGVLPCRNWAAGVAPEACSKGTEGHNTASIGGFVMLPPVILGSLRQGGGWVGGLWACRNAGTAAAHNQISIKTEVLCLLMFWALGGE